MAAEVTISSDELATAGYKTLAAKSGDNTLTPDRLDTPAARDEAQKLKKALKDETESIQGVTAEDLDKLLKEAENASQSDSDEEEEAGAEMGEVPSSVKKAADAARAQVKATFGNVSDKDYASHMSNTRALLLKWMPGLEVSSIEDISDALYQSDTYINKLIDYLEQQAADPSLSLNFGITGNYNPLDLISMLWGKVSGDENKKFAPGMYPSGNIDFKTPEEKQEYIQAMLQKLTGAMQGRKTGEWFSKETVQDGAWIGLVVLGGYIGGKIAIGTLKGVLNVVTFGKFAKLAGVVQNDPHAIDKAKKVGGLVQSGINKLRGKPTSGAKPAAEAHGAPATASSAGLETTATYRELDMTKPIEKTIHNGIIEEIYKAQNGGTAPTPDQAKNLSDSIKNSIATPNEIAEYQARVSRYLSIPHPPLGNPQKIAEYNAQVERAIRGETDSAKWNLKARAAIKANVQTNAAALSARLAAAHAASRTETIRIGGDEFKIDPRAKTSLNEIKNLEEQIVEQETEKAKLEAAKKKLEVRLLDEKKYAKDSKYLEGADTEVLKRKDALEDAQAEAEKQKSIYGETSSQYRTARANVGTAEIAYNQEVEKRKTAKETKTTLESKYININRGLIIDATGNLTDSTTMQKIESKVPGTEGVKEKIAQKTAEITRLEGEINVRMTNLNGYISGIPNAWRKAGIDVRMPDGTPERVTKLSDLFAKLVKASVKK